MNLWFVKPKRELVPFVQSIWVCESEVGLPPAEKNIGVPNGCPKLVVPYKNSLISIADGIRRVSCEGRLYLVGNRDSSVLLHSTAEKTGFIVFEFFPHGAFPIFGIPMIETAHGLWDSDWIFERWGHRLREELNYKGTVTAKVALIQERLIQLARNSVNQNRTVWYCVHTLKKMAGRISIRELEERTGYSQRCLEFLFQTHVGLPPKTLAGIFRFQRFYKRWAEGRMYDSLKSDLYDYYYDQSHFSREFKRMTGHSPRKYLLEVDNEYGRRLSLKD